MYNVLTVLMNNKNYVFASFNIYGNKMYNIRHEIAAYLKTHYIDCLILTEAFELSRSDKWILLILLHNWNETRRKKF